MSRLIDADNIIASGKYIKTNDKFEPYIMIDDLIKLLEEQPTAYDIDKVVEELKELPKCSTWNHNSDNIDRNKAIEIVKHGGVRKEFQ